MIPGKYWAAAIFLMAVMIALNIPNIYGQSPTVDEYAHVPAGYSYLVKSDYRTYPKNPPFVKMMLAFPMLYMDLDFPEKEWLDSRGAWGPWFFADAFVRSNVEKAKHIYASARIVNMLFGAALALVVFLWATWIFGPRAGLTAMAFTALSPTVLAHTGVGTVDMGFTFFFVLFLYLLMRVADLPTYGRVIAAGVTLGLALLSKYSALILIPLSILISTIYIIRYGFRKPSRQQLYPPLFRKVVLGEILVLAVVFAVGLLTVYGGYRFKTDSISMHVNPVEARLEKMPIPLPDSYLGGLDLQLMDIRKGEFPNYINGEWRKKGSPYYFVEALWLKEPLPALLFVLFGILAALSRFIRRVSAQDKSLGTAAWLFIHVPALVYLFAISLTGNLQLGVRYALPVLPLAFILSSAVLVPRTVPRAFVEKKNGRALGILRVEGDPKPGYMGKMRNFSWASALVIVLLAWQCLSVGLAAPHYLSYFNTMADGSRGGARYLLDSNLDWGQDLPSLKDDLEELDIDTVGLLYFGHSNPSLYGIKWHLPRPHDRHVAISVNFLHGYPYSLTYIRKWRGRPPMITDPGYRYLLDMAKNLSGRDPERISGGSIYIYDREGGGPEPYNGP